MRPLRWSATTGGVEAAATRDRLGVEAEVADLQPVLDGLDGSDVVCEFSSGAVLALEAARAGVPSARLELYEPPRVVSPIQAAVDPDYPERVQQRRALFLCQAAAAIGA